MKSFALGLVVLVGCSSSTTAGPVPAADTEIDSGVAETSTPAVDSAATDVPVPEDADVDTSTPPTSKAYVRIVDGYDGAEIFVCEDGTRLGGTYSRIGSGGAIASGYIETTKFGSRRVRAQASTSLMCMSPTSTDRSYTLAAGDVRTLFVRGLTSFNSILPIADDLAPPAAGRSRVRIFHGGVDLASTHGLVDVCVAGAPWATALAAAAAGPYQDVAPGGASVEIRKTAMPACSGAVIGTASVTTIANATHTIFIVDGNGTGAKDHLTTCTDANGGVPVTSPACSDTTL